MLISRLQNTALNSFQNTHLQFKKQKTTLNNFYQFKDISLNSDIFFKGRTFSDEQIEDILQQYAQGFSYRDIAQKYNRAHETIRKIIKKSAESKEIINKHNNSSMHIPTDSEKRKIILLYKKGYSCQTIKSNFNNNISLNSIISTVHEQANFDEIQSEHEKNFQNQFLSDEKQEIIFLYRLGFKYSQIYSIYNDEQYSIYNILRAQKDYKAYQKEHKQNYHSNKHKLANPKALETIISLYRKNLLNDEKTNQPSLLKANDIIEGFDETCIKKNTQQRVNINSETKKNIIFLYKNGYKKSQIAPELGVNFYTVNMTINSYGSFALIKKEHNYNYMLNKEDIDNPNSIKELIKQIKSGEIQVNDINLNEIKQPKDINPFALNSSQNIELNRDEQEIIFLYSKGYSVEQLSSKYKLSLKNIKEIINKHPNNDKLEKEHQKNAFFNNIW